MKKTDLQPVKGARDFIPSEFLKRQWLFEQMIEAAREFGFEQYDSPVLESLETYKTKSSSELVDEQSYRFTDRGGREVTLRPEMTPVLARMVSANQEHLAFPVKWFSIPVLWRYEKPQSGRLREHFQWNVDIIGTASDSSGLSEAYMDAEIISVLCTFFQKVGLGPDKIKIHINDRKDMQDILENITTKNNFPDLLKLIDRFAKLTEIDFVNLVRNKLPNLDQNKISWLIALLKNESIINPGINIQTIIDTLRKQNLDKYIVIDRKIVRGLDYYTTTVFEAFPAGIKSRAIAGGGRYDNLVSNFSNRSLPGIGFGLGDVVISNLLEKYNLYPKNLETNKKILISSLSLNALSKTLEITQKIRKQNPNLVTSFYPAVPLIRDVLNYGIKKGFNLLLIIGDKELSENTYTLKDLDHNHQTTGNKTEILKQIKRLTR